MRPVILAFSVLCLVSAPVLAQDTSSTDADNAVGTGSGESVPMSGLIDKGYEIKAAVPSGNGKLIIFLQNEKSAYACEFTNLAKTRCGSVN